MTTSWIRAGVVLGLAAWMAGCGGGGGDDPAPSPGAATIGAAGGMAVGESGAQVVFPKDALRAETTIRIAKDSTGAPPLPDGATPAGAVFMITPHAEAFAAHAEVSIPVEISEIGDNQQLLLVTAEPGDTQWRVLSGATYSNGVLRAPVMHFSFFQAIVLTNLSMPSLVTTLGRDGSDDAGRTIFNNVGGAGIGRFSPDFQFNQDSWLQYGSAYLQAKLTFPAAPLAVRAGQPSPPPPRTCLPTSLGHTGAAWRFLRNGTQALSPDVTHRPIYQVAESIYPRADSELLFSGYYAGVGRTYGGGEESGFGAVHVYGYDQNIASRGAFAPAGSADAWALPPAGNSTYNDQLMWQGFVLFDGEQHNGRMRIETTIATDCNLLIEAVPISFHLNLASRIPAWQPYTGVQALDSPINVPNGLTAVLPFAAEFDGTTLSIAWEYSHDAVNWEKLPVPAQYIHDDGPSNNLSDRFQYGHYYSIVIPNTQITQAGWYRAWACSKPIAAAAPRAALPSLCTSKAPIQLVVLTERPVVTLQPIPQIVQVGQTASFTVDTNGIADLLNYRGTLPEVTVQWQRRGLVEAAFGLGTWTPIDGATYRTYTTPPTTLNDTATLYRAVATTVLGSTASDAALLTVVEQLAPPVVQSQPGNLNVSLGGSAVFAATVTGTAPLNYQWRHNGVNVTGANAAVLTLTNLGALDAGNYDLVVTNRAGHVTSEPAALVVTEGMPAALAPTIAAPPASISVAAGNSANFAVSVNGTGPYTYLWMKNGVQAPIAGGDLPSLSIASVSTADAGTYSVRVSNSIGTVVSAAATLTVTAGNTTPVAPAISTQPTTLVVMPGAAATLAIAASGSGLLLYQWSRNGTPVSGATGAVLHLPSVSALDAGSYTVAVSNSVGSVGSSAAQLILVGAPAITTQPTIASAFDGGTVTFTVAAKGDTLRYQWTRNQVGIVGASSPSYTTPALTLADNGAVYGVIVYNGAGLVFSQGAVLTVTALITPSVTQQPANVTIEPGLPANLCMAFGGTPPFTVLMQRWDGTQWGAVGSIPINTTSLFCTSTPNLQLAETGAQFRFIANNGAATGATTNPVTVTVAAASTGRLALVANSSANTLSILRADPGTGALTSLGTTGAGAYPYAVAITPNGLFAYVTNLVGNNVASYSINTSTGEVDSVGISVNSVNPYGIAMDPLGRFTWVANYSASTVSAYSINGATGQLSAVGSPVATGLLPYALVAHPSGNFVYVANELGNSVSAFSVNTSTGALTLLAGTIVNSVYRPHAITVDPSGRFVYVAENGGSSVATFRVNASTGVLSSPTYANTGTSPTGVAVHPNGQFVYVTTSRGVSTFSINGTTGALTEIGSPLAAGSNPAGLAIDATGAHLYVTDQGGNSTSGFGIDATTGALTSLGATVATDRGPVGIAITP